MERARALLPQSPAHDSASHSFSPRAFALAARARFGIPWLRASHTDLLRFGARALRATLVSSRARCCLLARALSLARSRATMTTTRAALPVREFGDGRRTVPVGLGRVLLALVRLELEQDRLEVGGVRHILDMPRQEDRASSSPLGNVTVARDVTRSRLEREREQEEVIIILLPSC